jgi:hypothetical protein
MKHTKLPLYAALSGLVLLGAGCFGNPSTPRIPVPAKQQITQEVKQNIKQAIKAFDMIEVDAPLSGDTITSPLTVTGKARGNWYFEASFPIELKDGNGTVIATGVGQAQGDWMTTDWVPFTATLTYTAPATENGTLVLHNDNPSGLPENDKNVEIPVVFE